MSVDACGQPDAGWLAALQYRVHMLKFSDICFSIKMSVESILMDFQVLGSTDKEVYVR